MAVEKNITPEKIEWEYFFGISYNRSSDRYYKALIKGIRVEKHSSTKAIRYAIGNIDKARKKFKTEGELLEALNSNNLAIPS